MKKSVLFDNDKKLPGFPLSRSYSLKIEKNKVHSLYCGDDLMRRIDFNDAVSRRLFIVELVREYGFSKYRIHKATGISRQTIDNNLDIYDRFGKEGLVGGYAAKDGSRYKARKKRSEQLHIGNKAKLLMQERKEKREEADRKILELPLVFTQEAESLDYSHNCNATPCRYAGNFIYIGVIEKLYNFTQLLGNQMGKWGIAVWLFVLMLIQKIPSVEQLKTVFPEEFGILLGLKRFPSKPVIWSLLTGTYSLKRSVFVLKDFFKCNVYSGLISLSLLFVDGHLLSYTGKKKVHKAFSTQRRLAVPGRTIFTAFDHAGRYVDSILHEGTGSYIEAIKEFARQAQDHMGGHSPIIIGDREMWGVDRFIELKSEGIEFITWEKGSDGKKLEAMDKSLFKETIELNGIEYGLHEEKEKTFESSKTQAKVSLRRIVIWNKRSQKRASLVSNVEKEPMEWLSVLMLNRWGISENGNKRAKYRWNSDYPPGYRIEDLSEFQEIPNPEVKEIYKKIVALEKKRNKLSKYLASTPPKSCKDGTLRQNRNRTIKQREFDELMIQIARMKQEKSELPDRIPVSSLTDREFLKIDSESKLLYQVAQAAAFNVEKYLANLLKNYYADHRDVLVLLDMIRNCAGWVTITETHVKVVLEPLPVNRYRNAQLGLLTHLNSMNLKIGNGKILLFDIGNQPDSTIGLSKNSV
jgi:hypothetical protein